MPGGGDPMRPAEPRPPDDSGWFIRVMRGLERAMHGFDQLQLVVVVVFLVVGAPYCMLQGLHLGGVVLSGIGLVFAMVTLSPSRGYLGRRRRPVRIATAVGFAAIGAVCAAGLARPVDPQWQPLPGARRMSDPVLAMGPGHALSVLITGGRGALFTHDPDAVQQGSKGDRGWTWIDFPGARTWDLAIDADDGRVVAAPDREPVVYALAPGARRFRPLERPEGLVRSLAAARGRIYLVVASRLHVALPGSPGFAPVPEAGPASCVAAHGDRVLVGGPRFRESLDGGRTFTDLTPDGAELGHAVCAVTASGRAYVAEGGIWSSHFYARDGAGAAFVARRPPHRDVRVMAARGDQVVTGSWGGGVHHSTDGGASWRSLGLSGFEVRAMAVDFQTRRVFAAASNLTKGGIYMRTF
jgi:hypothetical protein